mmetsp:Transcript_129526/g.414181  ORF Transcript_129526/g.414181 Transcript_129526/m.414181 type:complete len:416 (-) Transcript_129526:83-1330(-)
MVDEGTGGHEATDGRDEPAEEAERDDGEPEEVQEAPAEEGEGRPHEVGEAIFERGQRRAPHHVHTCCHSIPAYLDYLRKTDQKFLSNRCRLLQSAANARCDRTNDFVDERCGCARTSEKERCNRSRNTVNVRCDCANNSVCSEKNACDRAANLPRHNVDARCGCAQNSVKVQCNHTRNIVNVRHDLAAKSVGGSKNAEDRETNRARDCARNSAKVRCNRTRNSVNLRCDYATNSVSGSKNTCHNSDCRARVIPHKHKCQPATLLNHGPQDTADPSTHRTKVRCKPARFSVQHMEDLGQFFLQCLCHTPQTICQSTCNSMQIADTFGERILRRMRQAANCLTHGCGNGASCRENGPTPPSEQQTCQARPLCDGTASYRCMEGEEVHNCAHGLPKHLTCARQPASNPFAHSLGTPRD